MKPYRNRLAPDGKTNWHLLGEKTKWQIEENAADKGGRKRRMKNKAIELRVRGNDQGHSNKRLQKERKKARKESPRQVVRTRCTPQRCYHGPSNGVGCKGVMTSGTNLDDIYIEPGLCYANTTCLSVVAFGRANLHLLGEKCSRRRREGRETARMFANNPVLKKPMRRRTESCGGETTIKTLKAKGESETLQRNVGRKEIKVAKRQQAQGIFDSKAKEEKGGENPRTQEERKT